MGTYDEAVPHCFVQTSASVGALRTQSKTRSSEQLSGLRVSKLELYRYYVLVTIENREIATAAVL